jgi:4'-phosphopantetheinyl transferase
MISCEWPTNLGDPPHLLPNEIHVWSARLDLSGADVERLAHTLSADETTRAGRFHFVRHRAAFVATRGILRQLLGSYTGHDPSKLQFSYRSKGKPFLASPLNHSGMEFNVAHSHGLALLAFSLGSPLGIDVEFVRSDLAIEQIADRYFTEQEIAELRSFPVQQRPETFFRAWTRKEAYMKALGEGLQIPLASFSVSLDPSELPTLQSSDSARWSIHSLSPAAGFVGAMVAESGDRPIHYWNLELS